MNKMIQVLAVVVLTALLSGCATSYANRDSASAFGLQSTAAHNSEAAHNMAEVRPDRMLIWKANLSIQVWSVSNAVSEVTSLIEHQGGFVEHKSDSGEESASITLRVPSKTFNTAVASFETLGTVTYRNIEGQDVTEQYIDVEARLKNKIVLRDRLKQLLEKATGVKDVLAIETELNRVQGDIDSMEGQIKSLKGQVDYATVSLSLKRRPISGPLGYLLKGLWWGVEKLFVIRD